MSEAYIVDIIRTPVGRRGGVLSGVHPADLAAGVIGELLRRNDYDPEAIDDVILGCLDTVGEQAGNIGRTAWLAAGLPESVPGCTVDRQCGSGQQAIHFAAQAVMSGTADAIVAGGVQSMTRIPMMTAFEAGQHLATGNPFFGSTGWIARYGMQEVSQFAAAEMIASRWDISRQEMEEYAISSHEKALVARNEGRFVSEVFPIGDVENDEGPRTPDRSKIESLPVLREGGRITAAVSSQMSDGAAVALIAGEEAIARFGLKPRARIAHISVRGDDPHLMLTAPISATRVAIEKSGISLDEIDLFEINEAFASVAMAWIRDVGANPDRVNVNGGAIALGHPLGATGGRIMATLLNELERRNARYGLMTMCEGGGTANVTIIERV